MQKDYLLCYVEAMNASRNPLLLSLDLACYLTFACDRTEDHTPIGWFSSQPFGGSETSIFTSSGLHAFSIALMKIELPNFVIALGFNSASPLVLKTEVENSAFGC
jgi:hypothetical protein